MNVPPCPSGAGADAKVPLGMNALWGFDGTDLTSPALAAAAGELTDMHLGSTAPTEFRIHGVTGSDGPTMLEHPNVLRVGGVDPTAIYRRWNPEGHAEPVVPWPAEAYSWGGLTEKPLASASWILLAPFMLYNVAYFTLPAARRPNKSNGPSHWSGTALIRLLALAATAQFVNAVSIALVSTIGWQNGIQISSKAVWWWIAWYPQLTSGARVALSLGLVGLSVAALGVASVRTARRYEAKTTNTKPEPDPKTPWPMARLGFWHGEEVVLRQRNLHLGTGFALAALTGALLQAPSDAELWSALVMILAVALTTFVTDRDKLMATYGSSPDEDRSARVLKITFSARITKLFAGGTAVVLLAGIAVLIWVIAISCGTSVSASGLPPGLGGLTFWILAIQGVLLFLLLLVSPSYRRKAKEPSEGGAPQAGHTATAGVTADAWRPFLGRFLPLFMCLLAVILGGVLSAVLDIGVASLFVPSNGMRFADGSPAGDSMIYLPLESFAFAIAITAGVVAGIGLAVYLLVVYCRERAHFQGEGPAIDQVGTAHAPSAGARSDKSDRVRAWYPASNQAVPERDRYVKEVAGSWALAGLTDKVGVVAAWFITVCTLAVIVVEGVTRLWASGPLLSVFAAVAVGIGAVIGGTLAGAGLWLLRASYSDTSKRKALGAVWDVGTFWPRAAHPLGPPCYAEQAVPEVVDRLRLLVDPDFAEAGRSGQACRAAESKLLHELRPRPLVVSSGRVLLTGYSQGSMIAAAVLAQLPGPVHSRVGLLTLACPFRRLYGRAFPAYFGRPHARALNKLLGGNSEELHTARWRNLVRHTDFIGSWIFGWPKIPTETISSNRLDVPSLDPPSLVPWPGNKLAPTHYHYDWWQDPLTRIYGEMVIKLILKPQDFSHEPKSEPNGPGPGVEAQDGGGREPAHGQPTP